LIRPWVAADGDVECIPPAYSLRLPSRAASSLPVIFDLRDVEVWRTRFFRQAIVPGAVLIANFSAAPLRRRARHPRDLFFYVPFRPLLALILAFVVFRLPYFPTSLSASSGWPPFIVTDDAAALHPFSLLPYPFCLSYARTKPLSQIGPRDLTSHFRRELVDAFHF